MRVRVRIDARVVLVAADIAARFLGVFVERVLLNGGNNIRPPWVGVTAGNRNHPASPADLTPGNPPKGRPTALPNRILQPFIVFEHISSAAVVGWS